MGRRLIEVPAVHETASPDVNLMLDSRHYFARTEAKRVVPRSESWNPVIRGTDGRVFDSGGLTLAQRRSRGSTRRYSEGTVANRRRSLRIGTGCLNTVPRTRTITTLFL